MQAAVQITHMRCIHICIHTHVYAYVCAPGMYCGCMKVDKNLYTNTYAASKADTYTYTYTCTCTFYICERAYVCMYVRVYVRMCVCVHVCMYVCMHACMHACMHVCVCIEKERVDRTQDHSKINFTAFAYIEVPACTQEDQTPASLQDALGAQRTTESTRILHSVSKAQFKMDARNHCL